MNVQEDRSVSFCPPVRPHDPHHLCRSCGRRIPGPDEPGIPAENRSPVWPHVGTWHARCLSAIESREMGL